MKTFTFCLVALSIAACAGRTYENDRRDERYQSGQMAPLQPSRVDPQLGTEGAVVSTAVSAAMIASNPGYYTNNLLNGKLLCGPQSAPALQTACPTLTVQLKSLDGKKVLASTQSDKGEFAFKVPKDEEFLLVIDSKQFVLATPSEAKYRQGDQAILRLKKK